MQPLIHLADPNFLFITFAGLLTCCAILVTSWRWQWRFSPLQMLALTVSCLLIALSISMAPSRWEDIFRLTPSVAMSLGFPLFDHPTQGPWIDWPYGPMMALVFLPIAFLRNFPLWMMVAAAFLSFLMVAIPTIACLYHFFKSRSVRRIHLINLVLLFTLFSLNCAPLTLLTTRILADSVMMFFLIIALGLFSGYQEASLKREVMIWVALSLAFWSKQLALPVLLLLPVLQVFLKRRLAFRFALIGLITFAVVSLVFIATIGWERIYFNMFFGLRELPLQASLKNGYGQAVALKSWGGWFTLAKGASEAIGHSVVPLFVLICSSRLVPKAQISHHPGLRGARIFLLAALALAPLNILARVSMGGEINNYASSLLCLTISALGVVSYLIETNALKGNAFAFPTKVLLLFLAGACAPQIYSCFHSYQNVSNWVMVRDFKFAQKNPSNFYITDSPIFALILNKQYPHSIMGLRHRVTSGAAIDKKRVLEFLPAPAQHIRVEVNSFNVHELFCPGEKKKGQKEGFYDCVVPEGLGNHLEKMSSDEIISKLKIKEWQ